MQYSAHIQVGSGDQSKGLAWHPESAQAITLFEMSRYELGHFKHGNLLFAAEDSFQLGICIDHTAVFGSLEVMLLDIVPHLFGDFGTRNRL